MVYTRAKLKKVRTLQSGALIGSSDDLLTEIFLRLPVTSIRRFKSVSKHWRSLLTHTHFTTLYDTLPKSPGTFARNTYVPFDAENGGTPFRNLDFNFDPCDIRIVQSCNGLLLCCSDLETNASRVYYVLNPTTKQFAIIPSIPGDYEVRKTILFMGLAFHQTRCVHYKVICIRLLNPFQPGLKFQILIYSSETGKWRVSIESFYTDWSFFSNAVYWNGAFRSAPAFRNRLYFNLDVEQLQTMSLPDELTNDTHTWYFGESRGHLHLIVFSYYLSLNVYEMMSDHSGWFVKYEVDLGGLLGAFPEIKYRGDYRYCVLDVVRGEKEEDTFLVVRIPRKLTFNVHDKSFKHIFNYNNKKYWEAHRYTETLASL